MNNHASYFSTLAWIETARKLPRSNRIVLGLFSGNSWYGLCLRKRWYFCEAIFDGTTWHIGDEYGEFWPRSSPPVFWAPRPQLPKFRFGSCKWSPAILSPYDDGVPKLSGGETGETVDTLAWDFGDPIPKIPS